jgi:hypothetical protein
MISLFQTASGSWHLPSILTVAAWLASGIFIFLNLYANCNDRVRSYEKEKQSVQDAVAAREKIAKLEEKTRTRTTAELLFLIFDEVDPNFRLGINSGKFVHRVNLRESSYGKLKSIAADDSRVKVSPSTNTRMDNEGSVIEVTVIVDPSVFQR